MGETFMEGYNQNEYIWAYFLVKLPRINDRILVVSEKVHFVC